ncbi:MAG: hypothetical protein ABJ242_08205 [Marinomonas sp.]
MSSAAILFVMIAAIPFLGLGFYRSDKVALGLIASVLLVASYYQWFDGARGPAAEEWGAQVTPVFFLVLAAIGICAFVVGRMSRLIFKANWTAEPSRLESE